MTRPRHTPGPWRIDSLADNQTQLWIWTPDRPIANIRLLADPDTDRANAVLKELKEKDKLTPEAESRLNAVIKQYTPDLPEDEKDKAAVAKILTTSGEEAPAKETAPAGNGGTRRGETGQLAGGRQAEGPPPLPQPPGDQRGDQQGQQQIPRIGELRHDGSRAGSVCCPP